MYLQMTATINSYPSRSSERETLVDRFDYCSMFLQSVVVKQNESVHHNIKSYHSIIMR